MPDAPSDVLRRRPEITQLESVEFRMSDFSCERRFMRVTAELRDPRRALQHTADSGYHPNDAPRPTVTRPSTDAHLVVPFPAPVRARLRRHAAAVSLAWACLATFLAPVFEATAQENAVLFYQGRIAADDAGIDGAGHFKFALVDPDASTTYWRNAADADGNGEPDEAVVTTIRNGLYGIHLGDTNIARMGAIPASLFAGRIADLEARPLHLRVWFDDGSGTFERLTPDQRVAAVGFAMAASRAAVAQSVPDGSVTAAKLAPGAVTASSLVGALLPAQVPSLDASKIGSGVLDASRLPSDLATKSTDLRNATNSLLAEIAALRNRIEALEVRVVELESGSGTGGGGGPTPAAPGIVRSSAKSDDTALSVAGYGRFAEFPAPAWAPGSVADAPSARYGSVAAWVAGSGSWLVWGGQTAANTFVASGGVYDPRTDAWRALPSLDAPSARRGGVAVSDGAGKVFVWGGIVSSGFADSGSFFDTSTFSWRRMSPGNQPSPRDGHVGFFTGSALVVWGGRDFRGSLGDGAAYHAELQTWSPLPASGAPTPRSAAAAVWTGGYGLIWGGLQGTAPLDSGARLVVGGTAQAPTYAWQTMTTAGAPSPRVGMATAWTGSRWLVWGGRSGDTFLADGASYDPASDTWSPLPASGAPAARAGAHAFWTGSEFVVLGGESNGGPVTDGAALDPVAGTWRALENSGDPGSRLEAVAAWSGSEVLLFGGRDDRTPLAALRRLTPTPAWYLYRKL